MDNSITSQYVNIGNLRIHYRTNDTEEDRTLLCIHGSGGTSHHWPELLFSAGPRTRVVAVDLPGHGKSDGEGYGSIDKYADFIEAFCVALAFKKVFTAGHSLGGAVVLTLGLRAPEWLSGIIPVGTGGRLRVTDTILDGILSDPGGTVDIISNYAWGPDASLDMTAAYKTGMMRIDPAVTHADFSACNRFDIMDRLGEIALPCLIISGTSDRLTPEKYGAFLHKAVPGSVFRTIENGGHMMALEKPEHFSEIIADFLAITVR